MSEANPPETPQPQPPSPPGAPTINAGKTQAANLCAVGLGVCFFLPWINAFLAKPSGYDFQQISDGAKTLWLMPIFCALTLYAGFTGKSQKIAGQLAGVAPFVILLYGFSKLGGDLFRVLAPGGWLALAAGAALFILVRR